MARAVSGGAVYVSDKPGQHDFTLLRRLVLPDGYILRAQLPGRPTRDCLFRDVLRDNKTMLKVRNWHCGAIYRHLVSPIAVVRCLMAARASGCNRIQTWCVDLCATV